jgi:hypothetical protein
MKKLILWVLCGLGQVAQAQDDPVAKYAATITQADLKRHLLVVASDAMEGRATGSLGQKKAADYLVAQFQRLGLTGPVTTNPKTPYLQLVPLVHKQQGLGYLELPGKVLLRQYEDFVIEGSLKMPPKPSPWFLGLWPRNGQIQRFCQTQLG